VFDHISRKLIKWPTDYQTMPFDLDVSTHYLPQPPADCLLGCNWLGGSTYFLYLAGVSR